MVAGLYLLSRCLVKNQCRAIRNRK